MKIFESFWRVTWVELPLLKNDYISTLYSWIQVKASPIRTQVWIHLTIRAPINNFAL